MVSVRFHSTSQISGFNMSKGINERRKDGPLYHGHLRSVAADGGEQSRELSLSEVTQGWMFIFRALNYLTTALTLSLSL